MTKMSEVSSSSAAAGAPPHRPGEDYRGGLFISGSNRQVNFYKSSRPSRSCKKIPCGHSVAGWKLNRGTVTIVIAIDDDACLIA